MPQPFVKEQFREKWRCPTGVCTPASRWIKADRLGPLIFRETARWRKLYKGRASVEREFGRFKNDWAMLPLRVPGLARPASRGPNDPRQARLRAGEDTSRSTRCVAPQRLASAA